MSNTVLSRESAAQIRAKNAERNAQLLSFADLEESTAPTPTPALTEAKQKFNQRSAAAIARRSQTQKEFTMTPYAINLLNIGCDKFIDNVMNPNPSFDNRNANRDTFLAAALSATGNRVKPAAEIIAKQLARAGQSVIASTIDALCYQILKNAMFDGWVNYRRALNAATGTLPDSFFAEYTRRSAVELGEVDPDDVIDAPLDQREEDLTAPLGCEDYHIEIGGIEWPLSEIDSLPRQIAEGLDEVRLHLENIRAAHGFKGPERLAFFVEQIGQKWVRHDGDVFDVLTAYELKMENRQRQQHTERENVFARAVEALKNAA